MDRGVYEHFKGSQELVNEEYDQFINVIDRYYDGLLKYGQKAQEYRDNAWNAFRKAQNFYNWAKSFIQDNYLDLLTGLIGGIGSWFDISQVNSELIDVEWLGIPYVADIHILHPTQIWNNVQPALIAYQQNFNQAVETINQLVDNLLNEVCLTPWLPRVVP